MNKAAWIWLNDNVFPLFQRTKATVFASEEVPFAVVKFRRRYDLEFTPCDATMHVSGDCRYRLYANGEFLGMGPAFSGGDWARTETMPQRYSDSYYFQCRETSLLLEAEVQLAPTLLCDISSGQGGFYLDGELASADGQKKHIFTDESWECCIQKEWINDLHFDSTQEEHRWGACKALKREAPLPSEIPVNTYELIRPDNSGELEKIVTGTLCCKIEATNPFRICLIPYETKDLEDEGEIIAGNTSLCYEGFRIRSVGGIKVEILSGSPVVRSLSVRASRYPGEPEGKCETGREDLDLVLKTCEHTLSICRQSIHLDSPRHMEPLGCTGDYWIESLMEYYCYRDHRLTRFDLLRTARLLKKTEGYMFHTGYSLMWVSMLRDYILYTGDRTVLEEAEESIRILLKRFQSYEDGNGILDTPPSYMFADWVEIAGYSMHHPPKALGQTLLNALYYRALLTAGEMLGEHTFTARAAALKQRFEFEFWDDAEGLYISGHTGETPVHEWLPQNADRHIFTLHANIMVVACGICDGTRAAEITEKVLSDSGLPDYQPYFAHFVFQALWNTGLFDRFATSIFERWIPMVQACSKGLSEGWIKPCDDYVFDHSHAWGGCPRYWLPRALIGLDILEPGFRKISLQPRLTGIAHAEISVPTPFGIMAFDVNHGKIQILQIPKEIEVVQ